MPDDSANRPDKATPPGDASETSSEGNNELASRLREAAQRATAAADAKPGPLAASPHRALARTADALAQQAEEAERTDDEIEVTLDLDREAAAEQGFDSPVGSGASSPPPSGVFPPECEPMVTGPLPPEVAEGEHRVDCPEDGCEWWTSSDIENLAKLHLTDHMLVVHGERIPASPQGVIELALELDGLGNRFSQTSQLLSGLHDADALAEKLARGGVSPTSTAEVVRECHAALKTLNDVLAS